MVSLDIETRSPVDLRMAGVHRYAEDADTDCWCLSFAFDGRSVVHRWFPGEPCPPLLDLHVRQGGAIRAWNAQFERTIWRQILVPRYGFPEMPLEQWVCSMSMAAWFALPRHLERAAWVLGLAEQKDAAGSRLMHKMAKPVAREHGAYRWDDDPAHLERLAVYCDQDVRTEMAIWAKLPLHVPPYATRERAIWLLDQEMNDRGFGIDVPLVRGMQRIAEQAAPMLDRALAQVTRGAVTRCTQVGRLVRWAQQQGVAIDSVAKETLETVLPDLPPTHPVAIALTLRQKGNKSSLGKLAAMRHAVCRDGRVRGSLAYHGANTGRWAGRTVQPQNFPRQTQEMTPDILEWMRGGDLKVVTGRPPHIMEVMPQALRSCIVAAPEHALAVADYSQIELRVAAWLSGAKDLLQAFTAQRSPYLDMGERLYGHPVAKGGVEYQVAKMTTLACIYQVGWGKLQRQARIQGDITLTDAFAQHAVHTFRDSNPELPVLWRTLEDLLRRALLRPGEWHTNKLVKPLRIGFRVERQWLQVHLPSGRWLWYPKPRAAVDHWPDGSPKNGVFVEGQISPSQWGSYQLYGGLLTNNIVQATARDLLADAMLRAEDAGLRPILTVHDEILTEVRDGAAGLARLLEIMRTPPSWAVDCPLDAAGWHGPRYRKDL